MTHKSVFLLLGMFLSLAGFGQSAYIHQEFIWNVQTWSSPDASIIQHIPYADDISLDENNVPVFSKKIALEEGQEVHITKQPFTLSSPVTDPLEIAYFKGLPVPLGKAEIRIHYVQERENHFALILFPACEQDANQTFYKLDQITFQYQIQSAPKKAMKKGVSWKVESALRQGTWAKVFVENDGVYGLGFDYVQQLGIGAADADVNAIRMYGYPGGLLPEENANTQYDDLEEIAIKVEDKNNNGRFDAGDRILFYGQNPNALSYDPGADKYIRQIHYYSTVSAYFITVGAPGGKRITYTPSSNDAPTYTTSSFDEHVHIEEEKENLIQSGRVWLGQEFDRETKFSYTINLPGQVIGEPISLTTNASARSEFSSNLQANINGQNVSNLSLPKVSLSSYSDTYACPAVSVTADFQATSPFNLQLNYVKSTSSSIAWLNYYALTYRRNLNTQTQLVFRDSKSLGEITRFDLQGQPEVWDVTDPLNIMQQTIVPNGANNYFIRKTDDLLAFASFQPNATLQPVSFQKVGNQNIHGEKDIEYLIVAHPDFIPAAEQLAEFHRTESGLSVLVTTPEKIYNEFNSGIADLSAIRNCARFLYENAIPSKKLKYLLLFGDASYDFKNIKPNNSNYVPTFQTANSTSPVNSFCSDDYFVMLDESEGGSILQGGLDAGVGRLPVQTPASAMAMVNKIKHYYSNKTLGDWRNNIALFADDEDGNAHLGDAESYSALIDDQKEVYNLKKVYADAYRQETIGNGQRYPDVTDEFNKAFGRGNLIINYSGHGGEVQLGHEKFLDVSMIKSFANSDNMPLFITATCEFSRYDDPARQSAGELTLLNEKGGAIALLTTVRLVYQYPNKILNQNFYNQNVFDFAPGNAPALGDIVRETKNHPSTPRSSNTRSFTLLGDPALKLAYPKHRVATTSINGKSINQADTITALSPVELKGQVQDHSQTRLSGFNGTVYVTYYGSKQTVTTLSNDESSPETQFEAYNSIIFKGTATVKNGEFTINFITPRDLPIQGGKGKISYYAENGVEDAQGFDKIEMSPEISQQAVADDEGPKIRVFMNDSNFVFGGITDENPSIFALVYDTSGINTTGIGIGRDITGELNANSQEQFVLNDYYTSAKDDFRSGIIEYPLSDLPEGRHSIKVKVWDVHNNSAIGTTEFIVAKSAKLAIQNLMNFPNPFVDYTTFSFEHNQQGKSLEVEVKIYDRNGTYVTSLSANVENAGSKFQELTWDGRRATGPKVTSGVYLFKIHVRTADGQELEESQRIVYIR